MHVSHAAPKAGRPCHLRHGGDPDAAASPRSWAGCRRPARSRRVRLALRRSDGRRPRHSAAGLRALKAGRPPRRSQWCAASAATTRTPVILMGYFNPIYIYGVERLLSDARAAGVDGLIVVDLPPEEDEECACRRSRRASPSFAWRRRRLTTGACPPSSRTRRASSTMSRSPASRARRRPISAKSRRRSSASSVIRRFLWWSASA